MEERSIDVGPYKVYAIIGFITGILAISMSPLFYFGVIVSIIGIVFSIKGKKSNSKEKYAQRGLLLNIIGLILSVIVSTVVLLLFIFFVVNNKIFLICTVLVKNK